MTPRIDPEVQPNGPRLKDAIENLNIAMSELTIAYSEAMIAMARVAYPILQRLEEIGIVDEDFQLTEKGHKIIAKQKKERSS